MINPYIIAYIRLWMLNVYEYRKLLCKKWPSFFDKAQWFSQSIFIHTLSVWHNVILSICFQLSLTIHEQSSLKKCCKCHTFDKKEIKLFLYRYIFLCNKSKVYFILFKACHVSPNSMCQNLSKYFFNSSFILVI